MVEGMSRERIFELTAYDPWFLQQFAELMDIERWARDTVGSLEGLDAEALRDMKRHGFSDKQIASWMGTTEKEARAQAPAWRRARLQACRHLRRGVRGLHAVPVLLLR